MKENDIIINTTECLKKKRGRKKKVDEKLNESLNNNIIMIIEETEDNEVANNEEQIEPVIKKRGRKPKGGKLINKQQEKPDSSKQFTNIILHLKCSMQELNDHNDKICKLVTNPLIYNPVIPPSIMTYNLNDNQFSIYEDENNKKNENKQNNEPNIHISLNTQTLAYEEFKAENKPLLGSICQCCSEKMNLQEQVDSDDNDDDINIKDINTKLKNLKLQLYKNTNPDKKSACFWCTYDYDNQSCYIPKYEIDGQIYGYGSFCRPECAVAYLMKEDIDDSIKFERYHLINQIYSKVYNFKKNIKPAPNPYFLLEKYYGNLSIQEYRKLLKSEHMLLVIDKPMTRILPELHEDSDEFIMNIYGNKSDKPSQQTNQNIGLYKVKRQSDKQKGPSKTSIMKENFGIAG